MKDSVSEENYEESCRKRFPISSLAQSAVHFNCIHKLQRRSEDCLCKLANKYLVTTDKATFEASNNRTNFKAARTSRGRIANKAHHEYRIEALEAQLGFGAAKREGK